jgi:hypothetical protein
MKPKRANEDFKLAALQCASDRQWQFYFTSLKMQQSRPIV